MGARNQPRCHLSSSIEWVLKRLNQASGMDQGIKVHTHTLVSLQERPHHTPGHTTHCCLVCLTDPWYFFLCFQRCSLHSCFFSAPNRFLLSHACPLQLAHPGAFEPKLSRDMGQETSGWSRGCGASGRKTGPEAKMLNGASASRNGGQ